MEYTKGELKLIYSSKHPGDIFVKIKGTRRKFLCKFYGGGGTEILPSEAQANVCHFIELWETQDTPAEDRYGREPNKVKPLAQYLDKYLVYEGYELDSTGLDRRGWDSWQQLLLQALDAYQSTENVTIKIERV